MDYNKLAKDFLAVIKGQKKQHIVSRFSLYSHGEYQVLFYLYKNAGKAIVPSDIAQFTNTSTARIATILNNLENKKMVTREISRLDRRKILVAITDKGRKNAEGAQSLVLERIGRTLEAMGEEQAKQFIKNLELFFEVGIAIAAEDEPAKDTEEKLSNE